MKQIPIKEDKIPKFNKKGIRLIILLLICGIITGLILSNIFVNETNERVKGPPIWKKGFDPCPCDNESKFNQSFFQKQPLTGSEILIPTIGVIIVCIALYMLIGLTVIYVKIFRKSKSKYIVGLLFFLVPLLFQTFFSINTLRQLFVSPRIAEHTIREAIGFGVMGLGGMLVILSIFEIIGLSILLYLSSE